MLCKICTAWTKDGDIQLVEKEKARISFTLRDSGFLSFSMNFSDSISGLLVLNELKHNTVLQQREFDLN